MTPPIVSKNKEEQKQEQNIKSVTEGAKAAGTVAKAAIPLLSKLLANVHPGSWLISYYRTEHKIKDYTKFYIVVLFLGWVVDFIFVVAVTFVLILSVIGTIYVILRGVNAWNEVVHILHQIPHVRLQ